MAFYAYVIYSADFNCYYKGHCECIESRLAWHNAGKTKSTKSFRPWKVVYSEQFATREEAMDREKYFKTAAGRRYLKGKLK